MPYTIATAIEFDAGHRVLFHSGKCKYLHGHRYKVNIYMSASKYGEEGMVVDFGTIRGDIGSWLNEFFDHKVILQFEDPLIAILMDAGQEVMILTYPATAEGIARFIGETWKNAYPITAVEVWETPNCFAVWENGS